MDTHTMANYVLILTSMHLALLHTGAQRILSRNVVHHMYHKYRFCKPTYGKVITFDIVQQRIQTEWYKLRSKLGKDTIISQSKHNLCTMYCELVYKQGLGNITVNTYREGYSELGA